MIRAANPEFAASVLFLRSVHFLHCTTKKWKQIFHSAFFRYKYDLCQPDWGDKDEYGMDEAGDSMQIFANEW